MAGAVILQVMDGVKHTKPLAVVIRPGFRDRDGQQL